MKAILATWASESRAPLMIVPIPIYMYVEETASPKAYQARFRELEALSGVTVHDPLPAFHALPPDQRRSLRFPQDVHPTPEFHRILAESLATRITTFKELEQANEACR